MTIAKKLGLAAAALGLIGFLALPQPAQAWQTSQSGHSECSESAPTVILSWSFTNTEPNEDKWAMDVIATDSISGNSSPKVTVNPGETATGSIDTGLMEVGKGSIVFDLTWTGGRSGQDSRTVHYDAIDCTPPEAPEFTAHIVCDLVDNQAVYILRILQTNDVEATFDPPDGTKLPNGDPVEVTATYANGDLQVTKTSKGADDCTPPAKIKVCRDNVIITINEDELLETDTFNLEDCEEEFIKVCRDHKVITINEEDLRDTDTFDFSTCKNMPEILPVTGPGAALAGMFGFGSVGTAAGSWLKSRKGLKKSLLN
ncbi:MAG: hypothetical protein R3313_04065 [Candidatus Saccharimonadales bacterium]|nr:hypothetical protein [Candidatus Saccharimonadales bacterium]